eukprot:CAMPEP_0114234074 /NCGR_PEP_ID=MMETSP0058-20121206/5520_1 /TAXON_ID=36894 /ORGANISM="Pyramimonas parkeae, CCMP726" /LENGTH=384 /DNA_ID=CAMNT_0001345739 /DNA_START=85 /DNA_END=1239 /DNA_ORIENTATION=-
MMENAHRRAGVVRPGETLPNSRVTTPIVSQMRTAVENPPLRAAGLPKKMTVSVGATIKGNDRIRPADATPQTTGTTRLEGIKDLVDPFGPYSIWLLDQFGVLHDGKVAYPDAVEAVRELARAGAKLIILSNSSRRSDTTLAKLEPMGFDPSWFAGVVTSGEITYQMLSRRPDSFWEQLGRKCIHFTWGSRGAIKLEGLDLAVVGEVADADFILAHGTQALGRGDHQEAEVIDEAKVKAILNAAAAKGIPMVVANPDLVTVSGPHLIMMPGTFAKWYNEMGGEVVLMGKPAEIVYTTALEMIGGDVQKASMVAVGDSLEHDVQGAANAGIDSVFVTGGIHAIDLPERCLEQNTELSIGIYEKEIAHLATKLEVPAPSYYIPKFKW